MTLLELLRQELPKRGGWPEGAVCVVQSLIDGELYFYDRRYDGNGAMLNLRRRYKFCKASDIGRDDATGLLTPAITREQYEATGWDGKSLPPVGCEVEVNSPRHGWAWATVISVTDNWIIAKYSNGVEFAGCHRSMNSDGSWTDNPGLFRPLRTEAERAIDEMVGIFINYYANPKGAENYLGIARKLYDAGYRK